MPASTRQRVARGRGWTLVHAESLAWLRGARASSVDAIIADPPYSSGGLHVGGRQADPRQKYSRRRELATTRRIQSFAGDARDQRSYTYWSTLWLAAACRLLRAGSPVCVWSDWRQLPTTSDAIQAAGITWRGVAVWTKRGAGRPQRGRFRADAEFVVWGSWTCAPVPSARRRHLTEKPDEVMRRIVEIAPRRSVVLDPFAGSGTTGVACLETGRRFVGVEQSLEIWRGAVERLRACERRIVR